MSSNHLIFCHLLILLPSIFPSIRVFPMSQVFASGGLTIVASASASVLPMYIQGWCPLGLTILISLLSKDLLQHHSLKARISLYVNKVTPSGKMSPFPFKRQWAFGFWVLCPSKVLNLQIQGKDLRLSGASSTHVSLILSVSSALLLFADWTVVSTLSHSCCHLHQLLKPDQLLWLALVYKSLLFSLVFSKCKSYMTFK